MDPERTCRLEALFHRAVDVPRSDRDAFLARKCEGDAALAAELRAMLREDDLGEAGPLETPLLLGYDEAASLEPDSRIGPYRVVRRVGSGGMGTVYEAVAAEAPAGQSSGARVALKTLHPHLLARPGFRGRMAREARAGTQVVHENVVRTLEARLSADPPYLVLEYVEGRTLRELLTEMSSIPEALVGEIALQVSAGLAAIHAAGLVHRDLKPENVMITQDHRVRIMDLGISRQLEGSEGPTREGQFVGSLLYAAPEQFEEARVGPPADLYALGVMLYELTVGEHPFRRDRVGAVIKAHMQDTPRRIHELRPEISRLFSEILHTLLEKEPARRFSSAKDLHEILVEGESSAWWSRREPAIFASEPRRPKIPVRRETNLYGRETELEILQRSWEEARAGTGRVILVEGEAGIGKTRLVDAFVSDLRCADARVLYGSYSPAGGLGGLSDAVIAHVGAERLEDGLRPHLRVMPDL
ncbi:MAG: serine/threonine-protein kinase, partial [Planctomycetota bacterium]